jgi:hypothetical protein
MRHHYDDLRHLYKTFDEEELKEAAQLFEWAMSYERRGLKIAADALRDEGQRVIEKYMTRCISEQRPAGV